MYHFGWMWLFQRYPTNVSSLGQNRDKLIFGNVTNEKKVGVGWLGFRGGDRKEGRKGSEGDISCPTPGGIFPTLG